MSAPPADRPLDRIRARAIVSGMVQGVSYRLEARSQAESLGLVGWVRNLRDGSVEVLAEGPREAVEQLLAWCRRGPRLAQVDDVEITYQAATGEFTRFAISH